MWLDRQGDVACRVLLHVHVFLYFKHEVQKALLQLAENPVFKANPMCLGDMLQSLVNGRAERVIEEALVAKAEVAPVPVPAEQAEAMPAALQQEQGTPAVIAEATQAKPQQAEAVVPEAPAATPLQAEAAPAPVVPTPAPVIPEAPASMPQQAEAAPAPMVAEAPVVPVPNAPAAMPEQAEAAPAPAPAPVLLEPTPAAVDATMTSAETRQDAAPLAPPAGVDATMHPAEAGQAETVSPKLRAFWNQFRRHPTSNPKAFDLGEASPMTVRPTASDAAKAAEVAGTDSLTQTEIEATLTQKTALDEKIDRDLAEHFEKMGLADAIAWPDNQLGLEQNTPNEDDVRAALLRATTLDLETGLPRVEEPAVEQKTPQPVPAASTPALGQVVDQTHTAVVMSLGGIEQHVLVPMSAADAVAAGLKLAKSPTPALSPAAPSLAPVSATPAASPTPGSSPSPAPVSAPVTPTPTDAASSIDGEPLDDDGQVAAKALRSAYMRFYRSVTSSLP